MHGLAVIEVMTMSGHLSNIDEIAYVFIGTGFSSFSGSVLVFAGTSDSQEASLCKTISCSSCGNCFEVRTSVKYPSMRRFSYRAKKNHTLLLVKNRREVPKFMINMKRRRFAKQFYVCHVAIASR